MLNPLVLEEMLLTRIIKIWPVLSHGMVQPAFLIKMKIRVKKIIQETSIIIDNMGH